MQATCRTFANYCGKIKTQAHCQEDKGVHQEPKVASSKLTVSVAKRHFTCRR